MLSALRICCFSSLLLSIPATGLAEHLTLSPAIDLIQGTAPSEQDSSQDSIDQRLAALESSVENLQFQRKRSATFPSRKPSIDAGYSFLFTKLHYKESFQATSTDLATGTLHLIPFDQDLELTPRVWVSMRGASGLGIRATYWSYDHDQQAREWVSDGVRIPGATSTSVIYPALIVAPFPGDLLTVESGLEATTADLEATYELRVMRVLATVGAGVRYADSDQTYRARVTPGPASSASQSLLEWNRQFEGFGPLVTANGKLPLGTTGFYGAGNVSAAFLFGEKDLSRLVLNDATPPPNTTPPQLVFENSDEITGIYGTSIGFGWERCGTRANYFLQGNYEAQLWTEGGAPTITFGGFSGLSFSLGVGF